MRSNVTNAFVGGFTLFGKWGESLKIFLLNKK